MGSTFIISSQPKPVGTTLKSTRGRPPWPHKALLRWTCGTSHPLSGQSHGLTCGMPTPCPDPVVVVPNRILDRISWAIVTHFAKSILDKTFLGLFRRPATTCHAPPVEWKDKGDGKSSPQQSLLAAYRIMMALPPFEYHHDRKSQRLFPPSKWRGSRHYKRPPTTQ